MPVATKKDGFHTEDDDITLQSLKQELKHRNKDRLSVSGRTRIGNVRLKKKKIVQKAIAHKNRPSKKKSSLKKERDTAYQIEINSVNLKRRPRRKNRKNNVELDEASRLQRRTRYLLIKLKLEQNLIDAYSAEGWKGQSREKIKPEKELLRARKEILKCKLGIREAIHQLDLLGSEGCISDSAVAPDGSVHHENIFCAKCKLRDAFPDNDIILCDGTCSCAFHQKCIDPPMPSEDIPPEDEGWFCKFCEKKMEIIEATNAHLGTRFPLDSNWEDVFREEADLPDIGNSMLFLEEEWPSDDSEDDDYNPNQIETSCFDTQPGSASDSSSCSLSMVGSLEDELSFASGRVEEGSSIPHEVDSDDIEATGPRKRAAVDYIKLHNEMFGKNATENEEMSEDEDWGPKKKKRKEKEADAATTLIALGDKKDSEVLNVEENEMKKRMFRLPPNAVEVKTTMRYPGSFGLCEFACSVKGMKPRFLTAFALLQKLRAVFAENELPSRGLRVKLSRQLGVEFVKVNTWFRNARYLALKARKVDMAETSHDVMNPVSGTDNRAEEHDQRGVDPGDDVSLKYLREKAMEKKKEVVNHDKSRSDILKAEADMEKVCRIKKRVEDLHQILLQLPVQRLSKSPALTASSVMYVPVAEVRDKR